LNGCSTDNIGVTSFSIAPNSSSFTCDDLGTNEVELTIADPAGNTATCTSMVTVVDSLAPVFFANALFDVNRECSLSEFPPVNGFDNCGGSFTATTTATLPIENQGTTVVTWTYDDGNGNMITGNQNIIINDDIAPIVLTQDITIDLNGNPDISITPAQIDNGSTDNCTITSTVLDVTTFDEIGVYSVQLSVTDGNNNTASETATVTVIDSFVSSTDDLFASHFQVYPNPASENIFIKFNNNAITTVDIQVYNVTGNLVKTVNAYQSEESLDMNGLTNGLYLLEIENGGRRSYVKVVVAK